MTAGLNSTEAFAPVLGLLPPELGRSLGPWLDKLAAAIGPLRARARTGTGAPDGFDGLSRRGPYERLVLSEWALADVAPEEFLRRAAQHEHPFYQLARRDEARAKTSIALFDPGPMQLGGPRVGQFAVLLVLAARAQQAGARFGWSMLQKSPDLDDPAAGLRHGVDEEGVRRFLLGRLASPPSERDLAPWFELARRDDWEDLWVVGPPDAVAPGRRLPGVKTPVGRVAVVEVFEPGVRALDLVVARGAHRRALRLALPPEADCLRLLRDAALAPKTPPPVRLARVHGAARPITRPLLLADGRKVAYVDAGGGVSVYTVPDAPGVKRPRFKRYQVETDHRVLGLGWTRRQLVMVTERNGALHLRDTAGALFPANEPGIVLRSDGWDERHRPASLALVELFGPADKPPIALFVDGHLRLIALSPGPRPVAHVWSDKVLGMATVRDAVRVVVSRDARIQVSQSSNPVFTPMDCTWALVCTSAVVKVAVLQEQAGGEWHVPQSGSVQVVRPPKNAEVLGLVVLQGFALGLLVLDADRRTLRAVGSDTFSVLFTLDAPARHATVTPRGDRVAFVHDDDGVSVWSVPNRHELLRLAGSP